MPQKKNPDPLELTRSKAAIVTSNLVSMLGIVKALPSGYSRDLQDIKAPLLGASAITLHTIKIMDRVVRSLQINKERMLQAASMGNISLVKLEFADATSVLKAHKVEIKPDELMKIINEMTPEKSLETRKSSGSPNLLEQEEMIKSLSQGISNYSAGIQKRTKMVEGSFDNLGRTVNNYLHS